MSGEQRRRPPSYAAFAREDGADAKRGYPEVDLAAFAAAHGLRRRHGAVLGAYAGVLPTWGEYIFDVVDGAFPDGRHGALEHDLYEVEVDQDGIRGGGSYYGSRTNYSQSFLSFLGVRSDTPPNEPFAGNAAWLPTTRVVIRVPEAALLPRIVISDSGRVSGKKFEVGGRRFVIRAHEHVSDETRHELTTDGLGGALAVLPDPFVRIEVNCGAMALTVNGYRSDPADLDRLVWAASAAARKFAAVAPAAPPVGHPVYDDSWTGQIDAAAGQLGLGRHSAVDFHRSLPRSPIPGCSIGALFGRLRNDPGPTWTTWHTQAGRTWGTVRGGAAIECANADDDLPIGGHLDEASDMYVEIVEGVAYTWTRTRMEHTIDHENILRRARQAWAATGIRAKAG